ncbi:oligosaccharide flippase family protein [Candidatus Falkowbacteria bacterium]|nr:oligosaccharide flippase family protein [Candidatus Falkowbacteria bacterium]
MRLSTKVAYNTIVQVASKVLTTILGLVAVAVMTRTLGKYGFGQYTTIMTFLSFFGVLADLGLTLVTTKMISEPGADQKKLIDNLFTLRFFSALFFLGLAPLIVFFFPYAMVVKIGVSITTLSFFFIALNQIFVGLFQSRLRMDKVSIAEVAGRSFLVLGVVLASVLGYGVLGMAIATVIASAVNFLLHFIFGVKFIKIGFDFDFRLWVDIIKRSWPLTITIIFNLIYLRADTLILSLVKSQNEVGLYGATYKVIDVLTMIPFMFAGLILPILSKNWLEQSKDFFKRVSQRSFDLMAVLAIPLVVGTQFLADDLMVIIAGEEFAVSGSILKILILAVASIFIGCVFSHIIVAIDKQKKVIGAYVFTSITALIGYLVLIPRFSYFGAAWVTIYSEVMIAIFASICVWKYSNFFPNLKVFFKSLLSAALMALALFFFYKISPENIYLSISLALLLSLVVYFSALYFFKGISRDDILSLLNKNDEESSIG